MSDLPPGFRLDNAPPPLPPGFTLDAPPPGQMEGALRLPAMAGSNLVKGAAGLAGIVGDVQACCSVGSISRPT